MSTKDFLQMLYMNNNWQNSASRYPHLTLRSLVTSFASSAASGLFQVSLSSSSFISFLLSGSTYVNTNQFFSRVSLFPFISRLLRAVGKSESIMKRQPPCAAAAVPGIAAFCSPTLDGSDESDPAPWGKTK